ncbi:MAG: 2-amino-4-hydroxy-6-hydroxymethyldihydropteridine diphosphokinase [Bacteroidales bacterium]|nr:2-amino-4-hydroxy-6-hydroxymethyldihydropteridine diphosphokinase [Bacteroidales bacterium]
MALVYLLLGTNLGDRTANLKTARGLLEEAFGQREAASSTVETKACGFDGPDFLNRVEVYRTRKSPRTVLDLCKKIEKRMGRAETPEFRADGSRVYHSRIIDIDILEYSLAASPGASVRINTPSLTVPHPQVTSRPFVRPLLDEALRQTIKTK